MVPAAASSSPGLEAESRAAAAAASSLLAALAFLTSRATLYKFSNSIRLGWLKLLFTDVEEGEKGCEESRWAPKYSPGPGGLFLDVDDWASGFGVFADALAEGREKMGTAAVPIMSSGSSSPSCFGGEGIAMKTETLTDPGIRS